MGIDVNFHFRLSPKTKPAVLQKAGFIRDGDAWKRDDSEGVFFWTAPTLVWSPFIRFDQLSDNLLRAELLKEVTAIAKRVGATAVACLPDTSEGADRSTLVPVPKLTSKALFATADQLDQLIPPDVRRMMSGED